MSALVNFVLISLGFVFSIAVYQKEGLPYTDRKGAFSARRIRGFAGGPSTPALARALAINVSEHLKQAALTFCRVRTKHALGNNSFMNERSISLF